MDLVQLTHRDDVADAEQWAGRYGADVVIHYRQARGKAEGLAAEVRALGRRAMLVQADVDRLVAGIDAVAK